MFCPPGFANTQRARTAKRKEKSEETESVQCIIGQDRTEGKVEGKRHTELLIICSGEANLYHQLTKKLMSGSHVMTSAKLQMSQVRMLLRNQKYHVLSSSGICLFCTCFLSVKRQILIRLVMYCHLFLKVYLCV